MHGWRVVGRGIVEYADDLDPPTLDPNDPHHTIIDVRAAAANFADRLMIDGRYQIRPRHPFVPGFEVAGVVVASNSPSLAPGDRVVGVASPDHGSWAERSAADARHLARLPDDLDWVAAIGLFTNAQTAWFALHHAARVTDSDVVLVHAAAGGVGSMAVQLARAAGCTVVGTASSGKLERVGALGADLAIDNRRDDWSAAVREHVDGVDVVVDPVGGPVFDGSWRLLRADGRYVVVGFASGDVPVIPTNQALVRCLSVHGMYWTPTALRHPDAVRQATDEIVALHRTGRLDPFVTVVAPLHEAVARLDDVTRGRTTGKTVLLVENTQNTEITG